MEKYKIDKSLENDNDRIRYINPKHVHNTWGEYKVLGVYGRDNRSNKLYVVEFCETKYQTTCRGNQISSNSIADKGERFCSVCGVSSFKVTEFWVNSKHGRNICRKCGDQIKTHGKPLTRTTFTPNDFIHHEDGVEIKLYNRYGEYVKSAYIDEVDLEKCSKLKWSYSKDDRTVTRLEGKLVLLHHFILDFKYNNDGVVVDHKDRDSMNNRRSNLRICKQTNNAKNCKLAKNNSSGVTGVERSSKNMWRATLMLNRKRIYDKHFKTFDEAVKARLKAEKKYFKEFAPQQHLYEQYGIK